jgi:hypothetical protein
MARIGGYLLNVAECRPAPGHQREHSAIRFPLIEVLESLDNL